MMATVTVALLLSAATSLFVEVREIHADATEELTMLADIIAQHCAAPLAFEDRATAEETLASLRADPAIIEACIHRMDGSEFARYPAASSIAHPEAHAELTRKDAPRRSPGAACDGHCCIVKKDRMMLVARYILLDNTPIGTVHLAYDLKRIDQEVRHYLVMFGGITALALAIALLLSAVLRRLVSDPLQGITRAIAGVTADRDYSLRISMKGADELGSLATGFNNMLEQIQLRDAELSHYSSDLEAEVRLRTEELARSNRDLAETVDKLENAKQRAEEANRIKSEFLANMSHEIRTPMNGVLGLAQLLATTPLPSQQQQRYVEGILNSGRSLLAIIDDILDFSKLEAGKLRTYAFDFDLIGLIEDVVVPMGTQIGDKDLELVLDFDSDLPEMVKGDPDRLRQVLVNLMGNAVKFTDQGEVLLRVRPEPDHSESQRIRFEVTDTGPGIPLEAQERIFDSFTQVDGSTTRRHGGTGLGLSICQKLVELMGGTIGMASHPGQGATFRFSLPLPAGSPEARKTESGPLAIHHGCRVLIAVARDATARILRTELQGIGFDDIVIVPVGQAMAAIRAAAVTPFNLAILDLDAASEDFLALARELKADGATASIRLLMLARQWPADRTAVAREAGVDACLHKPVTRRNLADAIRRLECREETDGLAAAGRSPAAAPRKATMPQGRVLVAEDNFINLQVAESVLEHLGYRVDVAADGEEAVLACRNNRYDLILMDCLMPNMGGCEATEAIRRHERETGRDRVPIIALTANALEGDRNTCLKAGMDDYLSKPLVIERLRELLMRWLPTAEEGS